MHIATGRPVGPIGADNGSKRPGGIYIPYMIST